MDVAYEKKFKKLQEFIPFLNKMIQKVGIIRKNINLMKSLSKKGTFIFLWVKGLNLKDVLA